MQTTSFWDTIVFWSFTYIPRAVLGIVVLWLGWKFIDIASRKFQKWCIRKHWDETLRTFVSSLTSGVFKIALVITVAGMVGIETTSFIAILGAIGLAIGLALQGSLGNFAGGVLLLVFKPFKVGDQIEALGHTGTVKELKVFYTILLTPDNRTVILPNGPLSTGCMVNYSSEELRRVDWSFAAAYESDISTVQGAIHEVFINDSRVLKEPAPFVMLGELADSSINFTVRVWVNKEDYWAVYFDTLEKVKLKFDEKKISIPFPQQDVHVYGQRMGTNDEDKSYQNIKSSSNTATDSDASRV